MLNEFQMDFIKCLIKHKVFFVLIGGYAVISKGVRRTTADIDFFIKPTSENGSQVIKALIEFGLELGELDPEEFKKELNLAFGFEPNAVDLVNYMPQLTFDEVYTNAVRYSINEITIPIIDIRDLITCKSNLNREGSKGLIDQYDVVELKKILDHS